MKKEFEGLTTQEKIDTRENLIKQMRDLNEAAKKENRDLTGEEKSKFDAMEVDIRELIVAINDEKRNSLLAGFSTEAPEAEDRGKDASAMEEFRAYLKDGNRRNLTIDGENSPAGALAPTEYVHELLKDLEKETPLLGKVRKVMLSKVQDIEVPKETAEISDASWYNETGEVAVDEQQAFGSVTIGCDRLGRLVKVSKKTVLASAFDMPNLIKTELTYKLRCALENAILNGTGTKQPKGVFAGAFNAANDYQAAGQTALTADDIIKAKRKMPSAFRSNGIWVLHPDVVTNLLVLKDKNDQYIWRSGLLPGDPDILDGSAIIESEFAPATLAADGFAGLFGDFSKYWLTMLEGISIQVLAEKYATEGNIGYLAEAFAGGAVINDRAFARIKMAAA